MLQYRTVIEARCLSFTWDLKICNSKLHLLLSSHPHNTWSESRALYTKRSFNLSPGILTHLKLTSGWTERFPAVSQIGSSPNKDIVLLALFLKKFQSPKSPSFLVMGKRRSIMVLIKWSVTLTWIPPDFLKTNHNGPQLLVKNDRCRCWYYFLAGRLNSIF